jgi:hypothetical protein
MIRCAVIDTDTNLVVNAVGYEAVPEGVPPGFPDNCIAVADDYAVAGWTWDGTTTSNPNPPPAYVPPEGSNEPTAQQQVMFDHENRLRAIEGTPPLTMEDFVVQMRGM